MQRFIILLFISVMTLMGCGTETKVVTEIETVTVEVEKEPYKVTFSLTALGYDVQDDYPVVIQDGEVPENIYFSRVKVEYRYLDDNKWSTEDNSYRKLDKNQLTLELYKEGVYSFYIYAYHSGFNGIETISETYSREIIVEVKDNTDVDIDLIPYISSDELDIAHLSGERKPTVYDYLTKSDKICHVRYNQYFSDYFYTADSTYLFLNILCKEEAVLSEINLGMGDDVTFTLSGDYYYDPDVSYPGSSSIYVNQDLQVGNNYKFFRVENNDESSDLLHIIIDSLVIDTSSEQQIITNVVNDTKYFVERGEFYVPDTQEVVLMALYSNLVLDEVCMNQQSFKINGELIESDYYSNEKDAYCYMPTGLEGQNVFLNIYPEIEVTTRKGWIFESDEPGLKIVYAKGYSPYVYGDKVYIEWFAE